MDLPCGRQNNTRYHNCDDECCYYCYREDVELCNNRHCRPVRPRRHMSPISCRRLRNVTPVFSTLIFLVLALVSCDEESSRGVVAFHHNNICHSKSSMALNPTKRQSLLHKPFEVVVHHHQLYGKSSLGYRDLKLLANVNIYVDSEPDGERDKNINNDERNLRFAGVGRLYSDSIDVTTTTSSEPSTAERSPPTGPPPPHIEIVNRLSEAKVAVIGLGGVGSWAAEALCRSGVGHLVLVDLDDICISNTNRQLHTTSTAVGSFKIDEMERRLKSINPDVDVTLVHDFVSPDNVDDIFMRTTNHDDDQPLTAVLDAIDGSRQKSALIAFCAKEGIPIVTCGGSAGRTDPTQFVVDDLTRVSGDPLLSSCRKILRKRYGFDQGVNPKKYRTKDGGGTKGNNSNKVKQPRKWNIQCVISKEPQKQIPKGSDGESSLRRCDGALGTACFVTGTSGFIAAGQVVEMIAKDQLLVPRFFEGNIADKSPNNGEALSTNFTTSASVATAR